jgi:hypothetical protein
VRIGGKLVIVYLEDCRENIEGFITEKWSMFLTFSTISSS